MFCLWLEEIVDNLLSVVEEKEIWDFYDDFVFLLLVIIICEIFGILIDDIE